ncbi:MAG: hypothetical protein EA379_03225, partial [Phycisphaerales bacterium]
MSDKPKSSRFSRESAKAISRWSDARRREIRRTLAVRRDSPFIEALRRPETGALALIGLAFLLVMSAATILGREAYVPAAGRVMNETRLVRAEFAIEDELATQKNRESERLRTPRVYQADRVVLDDIESSLLRLPRTLADAQALEEVAPEIRERFALDDALLAALRSRMVENEVAPSWRAAV